MYEQIGRAAPKLQFTEDKDWRCNTNNFYMLPQELMDAVMAGIKGNCLNQLKLMILLLGTKENFRVSEQYVLQHLNITQQAYLKARRALVDKGWLVLSKNPHTLTVNLDKVWEDYYDLLRKEDGDEESLVCGHSC